ncbi:hypothetical protein COOONC_16306 [Cooperia oncophora]
MVVFVSSVMMCLKSKEEPLRTPHAKEVEPVRTPYTKGTCPGMSPGNSNEVDIGAHVNAGKVHKEAPVRLPPVERTQRSNDERRKPSIDERRKPSAAAKSFPYRKSNEFRSREWLPLAKTQMHDVDACQLPPQNQVKKERLSAEKVKQLR